MTRVIIADDHALFREGLRALLSRRPDIQIEAEIDNAETLTATLAATACDVLLLDLQMGRWVMDMIPELALLTTVVVLTANETPAVGVNALQFGARAIVHKRFAIENLMQALDAVSQGSVWMPTEIEAALKAQSASNPEMTPREREIVRCVATGMRNAEVADKLSITEATVKTHLNNIFQKLGLRDRIELVFYAIQTGMVGVPERIVRRVDPANNP